MNYVNVCGSTQKQWFSKGWSRHYLTHYYIIIMTVEVQCTHSSRTAVSTYFSWYVDKLPWYSRTASSKPSCLQRNNKLCIQKLSTLGCMAHSWRCVGDMKDRPATANCKHPASVDSVAAGSLRTLPPISEITTTAPVLELKDFIMQP